MLEKIDKLKYSWMLVVDNPGTTAYYQERQNYNYIFDVAVVLYPPTNILYFKIYITKSKYE